MRSRPNTFISRQRDRTLLYSWGLRHLLLVAPILAPIVYPLAGPVAAVVVVMALLGFDRFTTT